MKKFFCLSILFTITLFSSSFSIPSKRYESLHSKWKHIDIPTMVGASKNTALVYKDYSLYLKSAQGLSQSKRTRLFKQYFQDPNFRLSYIVFFLDDIAKLRRKYEVGTVSMCFSQSFHESNFGTSSLGQKGNHFGIKGSFKSITGDNGVVRILDDGRDKSSFGTSGGYGYSSFVKYFQVLSQTFNRVGSKHKESYKNWAYALQYPYKLCPKCKGYGCSSCRYYGLKDCTVYATMKYPKKKANPPAYTQAIIKTIEKYKWYQLDNLSTNQLIDLSEYIKYKYGPARSK